MGTKISALNALTGAAPDDLLAIVDTSTGETMKITVEQFRGYKIYRANIAQGGSGAPVATVLENTLGGDVVWTFDAEEGDKCFGTLAGAFPAADTGLLTSANTYSKVLARDNDNTLSISGGNFSGVYVEVKVNL
jgi:hypothetical protein